MKSVASSTQSIIIVLSLILLSVPVVMPVEAQSFSCSNVTEIPLIECEALVALYNSTGGDYWEDNTNWLVTNTPSNWYGVMVTSGQISRINLGQNFLSGSIPPELGNLTALEKLDLSWNQSGGSIPPELGNLTALTYLSLYRSELTGSIPPELGSLASLSYLWLSSNQLTGGIPPELGNLASLRTLRLEGNQLTGNIPPELGSLASLQRLSLYVNQLTGSIPPELGNLASLQELWLDNNQLTGSIPPELGNLASLQQLRLTGNQLTGSIPPELGSLASLWLLALSGNQLTGSIPPELGNLSSLQALALEANQLTGSIPPELGNLASLRYLWLDFNQLTGNIPPELGNLASLEELWLFRNQLTGSIPPELGSLASLRYLRLDSNQLTGSIPPELGNLTSLQALALHANQLTGSIPLSFVNLPSLHTFSFYETSLCEPIRPEYLAWVATVANYHGTGVFCLYDVPWLFMYYIAADNDLDREGNPEKLLNFLLSREGQPGYNIAVMYDASEENDSRFYYIADNTTPVVKGEVNSGDPDTLVEFVNWARGLFSAEHTALSIFGHGSLTGAARDDSSQGAYIELTELESALRETVWAYGKIDIVLMEACVMGTIEAAYQIRDYTDFYVASENTWWGPTYPRYLDTITSSTQPEQLATSMAQNYHSDLINRGVPHTVSVGQLSAMSRLSQEVDAFSDLVRANIQDHPGVFASVLLNVQRFDSDLLECVINYYDESLDLYDFARLFRDNTSDSGLRDAAQRVMNAVQDADPAERYIIYNERMSGTIPEDLHCGGETWDLDNSHGVSIFFPKPDWKRSFYTGSNLAFAEGTDWAVSTQAQSINLPSGTIQWGPMLVDYVEVVSPDASDDPTLPPLRESLSTLRHLYLPLIRR